MDFDVAVAMLASPSTWCEGAGALAELADAAAMVPLLRAYEAPVEAGKVCLLDAMAALGGAYAAAELYRVGADEAAGDEAGDQAGRAERRRLAVHLMELFADDGHLPLLVAAIRDPDEGVRHQAARALVSQQRSEAWNATIDQLLDAEEPELRRLARSCRDAGHLSASEGGVW